MWKFPIFQRVCCFADIGGFVQNMVPIEGSVHPGVPVAFGPDGANGLGEFSGSLELGAREALFAMPDGSCRFHQAAVPRRNADGSEPLPRPVRPESTNTPGCSKFERWEGETRLNSLLNPE